MRDWWSELASLVLPVACAGCGRDDVAWCDGCRALLAGPAWRCEERAGRLDLMGAEPALPVWALADFRGPVREAVVAWKDRGRHDLTRHLGGALRAAAVDVVPRLGSSSGVLVVGAPSTRAAVRRRGGSLVGELAGAVATGLCQAGVPAAAVAALVRRGGDQVGLGVRDRWLNVAGQITVRASMRAVVDGSSVVLVDDVLTTGATLRTCRAALEDAGAHVVAALTIASTAPPGRGTAPSARVPSRAAGGVLVGDDVGVTQSVAVDSSLRWSQRAREV
jgi:predicted amidophosphoribosyltransferase